MERSVLWLVWGILHVEKAAWEYRKFYGLVAVGDMHSQSSQKLSPHQAYYQRR